MCTFFSDIAKYRPFVRLIEPEHRLPQHISRMVAGALTAPRPEITLIESQYALHNFALPALAKIMFRRLS